MTSILAPIETGILSRLSAGTALVSALGRAAIYCPQAPDSAALPYVIYSLQAGFLDNTTPRDRHDCTYFIRAYARTKASAESLDGMVSDLIHKQTLTISGYSNWATFRESDLSAVESSPGGLIYMAGAFYRIQADKGD